MNSFTWGAIVIFLAASLIIAKIERDAAVEAEADTRAILTAQYNYLGTTCETVSESLAESQRRWLAGEPAPFTWSGFGAIEFTPMEVR